jgi:hypothetical protein
MSRPEKQGEEERDRVFAPSLDLLSHARIVTFLGRVLAEMRRALV